MRYEIHESAVLPPRAVTFLLIAAMHAAFAYLFISGLAQSAFKMWEVPIQVVPVPKPLPPVVPPKKVPPPTWTNPNITLVPPEVPGPPPETAENPVVETAPPPGPVSNPIGAQRIHPDPIIVTGAHRLPNTQEYYPAHLIRQGVEGTADVQVCVDANGRLRGTPSIVRSSGHAGLDRGAVNVARDGRYARSTQGGRPVPNCHSFRIIFDVNER
jgi:TonB family protein